MMEEIEKALAEGEEVLRFYKAGDDKKTPTEIGRIIGYEECLCPFKKALRAMQERQKVDVETAGEVVRFKLEEYNACNGGCDFMAGEIVKSLAAKGLLTSDTIAVKRDVVSFLLGEGQLEGKSFGEPKEVCGGKYKASYWWRKYLPALAAAEGEK